MSEELTNIIGKLVDVVSRLDAKLDSLVTPKAVESTPEPKPAKKRGRPKKVKPEPEPLYEEIEEDDDDDDDDEDDNVYRGGEKKLAISSGLRTGKRNNQFNPNSMNVATPPEDVKALKLIKSGKMKQSVRRPPVKEKVLRCGSCRKKFKLAAGAIIQTSLEDDKWFCNGCSGSGA